MGSIFTRPCHDTSPECLKVTVQAGLPIIALGVPELGIERLDPYILKKLNLKLPGGLAIQFGHGFAKGLKSCIVDYARFEEDTFETQLHCNLTIKGKYRSSGRLLLFPIDGDGDTTILCKNLKLHSVIRLGSKVKSDGLKYFDIKSSSIDHSYDGQVSYIMTNLFRGSPEISQALLNFMNSNWKLVADEFGTPIVDFGTSAVMRNVRRLLEVVPIEEFNKP
ncbi:unnamed protein product [Chrysodeixis includens]|uniref:Uncharacterized protein n=1 Tax=Chrysodeixis includens TaxID=689277 RepID=A0A9P0FUX8_CHRIL|nr:unnamed protein product [Chrysodeixis includens]